MSGRLFTFRQFLGVVEMRTKAVSMATLACATAYALRETGKIDFAALALAVPAVLFVDMGTTAFNSFFDYWRGSDDKARIREADKVLVTEGVPALAAFFIAGACYLAAAVLGFVLALRRGAWVVPAGLLSLAAGFLYNGGPRPISRTPIGELVAGGFLGSFLFPIVFRLETGFWAWKTLLASLPAALFIASILAVNNACDIEGDREAGRKTLAIIVGARAAALFPPALGLAAFALQAGLAAGGILPIACAFAAPVCALASAPIYARMLKAGFSHDSKSLSMRGILAAFLIWGLGYCIGVSV
jgi:1,4-dihydroxy-2-naphthoate octaprenyltransferase